ncbi:MAG TPA: ectoine/hydroxyectoine ABC transporter ATP-binding protein EhuA [Solirubrobacteraceae bacterium]|jgi:polar amino acid transport system ATP-binding protein|nr:ectoine/hydroxyectoine ABC transporter ATP-binding protein EhuA [Solirubrobacteraceae bacterium]
MVEFVDIEKRFGEVRCLDHLGLSVAPGEKLAVIGPSGSGKTTILRLLMGLERPTSGKVLLKGAVVWDEPGKLDEKRVRAAREKLGFVFQHFNLFPHMTALRNVAAGPMYAHGVKAREAEARAHELLGRVGLSDKASKYPSQLSGGQQQRVAIARALAMQPEVMLFDEPTSALDPELVGEVLQVIMDLGAHSNVTMLLVTHEMNFARQFADRVAFCDGGRVVEDGPPEKIFTDPEQERTRGFLKAVSEPV